MPMDEHQSFIFHSSGCTVKISGPAQPGLESILSQTALDFIVKLHQNFEGTRQKLLQARELRQKEIQNGQLPGFLAATQTIRNSNWKVAKIPADLERRRVEITGPVERKMIINALNSGADVFMADFEDSNSPTWQNVIQGQKNLIDAVRRQIEFKSPEGKLYRLADKTATLVVRPRGWHLAEKHMRINGAPVSAALFDFGLYFFYNARELAERKTAPYFYLPKMESHLEARLWNDVFNFAQDEIGIPRGTIRATVLIETILAAFEMDEILYELRDHSSGLNCGRWDYIFSFIKKFSHRPDFVLPDRSQVTMDKAFLKAYVDLLTQPCHKRGIHAMGGMAAQIPIKSDPVANEQALAKVRADKLREVAAGHDGTWVAHPGLVPLAMEIFDSSMKTPNQINIPRTAASITPQDLLAMPAGDITLAGLKLNIEVGLMYIESWLRGAGCVPIHNLMEDAATAEICRSQIWQWRHHHVKTREGAAIDETVINSLIHEKLSAIRGERGDKGFLHSKFPQAADIFQRMCLASEFPDFLTLMAYDAID